MRVLVVGSVRNQGAPEKMAILAASREIGKSLAERGHTILVGSDDPDDVDPEVVAGAGLAGKSATVEVHLMQGATDCYPTPIGSLVIKNRRHRYHDWDVTVLEVLRHDADAVIAIAGRTGVVQTGITGWMLGRPVIPVAAFQGGGKTIWSYGSGEREGFYFGALSDETVDGLTNSWNTNGDGTSAALVMDALERVSKAAARAKTPPRVFLVVSGLVLFTLMVWVALLVAPYDGLLNLVGEFCSKVAPTHDILPGANFLLLLISVWTSGALGGLMQTLRGVREDKPATFQHVVIDGVLGMAAGFLTASLYLIAQIAITGKLDLPTTDIDYVRVALIVGLAALFSSLYLDAALARFDGLKDSVISGKYGVSSGGEKP